MRHSLIHTAVASALVALAGSSHAAQPVLIATGSLSGAASDLSGLNYTLENGVSASLLGGPGSGLAWAGGNTFLALPDRGPNAVPYNPLVDDTSSYIARFHTVQLDLVATQGGALPYTITPTLQSTTLLYSNTALNYGTGQAGTGSVTVNGTTTNYTLGSGVPTVNSADKNYFTGRSDGFAVGSGLTSSNPNNARLDPEAIRVSNDGKSVFISDEYGPYVYQFDRNTGQRLRTFNLPDSFAVANLSAQGKLEISGNSVGRVANKGMEGLAISPDGQTLFGFMQSALIQDGGNKAAYNRIVKIDVASGKVTGQYAYNNVVNGTSNNSSELLALNDHQLLVLERDGNGLGDGTAAGFKQIRQIELNGAADVSNIANLVALDANKKAIGASVAINGTLFLDIKQALLNAGYTEAQIPAKLEGIAFGQDITINGVTKHTLYLANDNDFLGKVTPSGGSVASQYDNQFFVFAYDGNDLVQQNLAAAVPEPSSYAMLLAGLGALGFIARRRRG